MFCIHRLAKLLLVLFLASPVLAADHPALDLKMPVLPSLPASDKFLLAARESDKAYVVDLSAANDGIAFQAGPQFKLPPGRYRLHVLLQTGPSQKDVVDPIELTITAGPVSRHVLPREIPRVIPKTGPLTDLFTDFSVADDKPVPIELKWFVGDTLLEVPLREKGAALQKLLKRRAAELTNVASPIKDTSTGVTGKTKDTAPLDDITQDDKNTSQLVSISKGKLPQYRMLLAGIHIETICPVAVEQVKTDKVAYDADEQAHVHVSLKNYSAAEFQGDLAAELLPAELAPADKPQTDGAPTRVTAKVTIPANSSLDFKFPEPFPAGASGPVTRLPVHISSGDLRPATAQGLFVLSPPKQPPHAREKKIYAHYMACWPVGTGPLFSQRHTEATTLRHEASPGTADYFGGHVRNFDLVDPEKDLGPEASADLEIRRAMRVGIDGFSIDAWAGGAVARATLDALFKVAEEKNYPFEITICIDTNSGGNLVDSVKELLQKHGKSPKLARRDGKPLIFGYMSVFTGYNTLLKYAPDHLENVRAEPIGWHLIGQSLDDAAKQIGQPISYQFCLSSFFYGIDQKQIQPGQLTQAAAILAKYSDSVGGFTWLGPEQPQIAKAVHAAGAEWAMPVGMFQKENIPFECYVPKGSDYMHWGQTALDQDATLIQLVTWNDYGENTCVAPAYNTRYTLSEILAYEIKFWKTGKPPEPDHDRVYLLYRKYPPGAKIFPFHAMFNGVEPGVIEVLTVLPKPAHIRLPGRSAEYDAPAGLFRKQFPVTAGPMIAELLRNDKVELHLESPEPITDKPFREDNGFVCWSSEDERLWKEDFGPTSKPFWYSEYGDIDHDGLPNWFEMYWFSKERGFKPRQTHTAEDDLSDAPKVTYSRWLDFSTAALADPKANPSGDGKTNLEHFLSQTDPTKEPPPKAPTGGALPQRD